jgi:inorganic triphosphatase YgiF
MGAEFEIKFRSSPPQLDQIRQALAVELLSTHMETVYYDTPDADISGRKWMIRCRKENDESICTLKTPGKDGVRGEWETAETDILRAIPELCKLSGLQVLADFAAKGFAPLCGARFTRRSGLIQTPDFTAELALDLGCLYAANRETPLAEVELELLFPEAQAQPFLDRLTDMTAATVEGMETGKEYRAFPVNQ